jgi:Mg/Co/Ni transporter MgtE
MTPCVAALKPETIVDEAIEFIRKKKDLSENIENLHDVDAKTHPVGVLNIQKLP